MDQKHQIQEIEIKLDRYRDEANGVMWDLMQPQPVSLGGLSGQPNALSQFRTLKSWRQNFTFDSLV